MRTRLEIHQEAVTKRRHVIKSYRSKADAKRTAAEKFADLLTSRFGTTSFLLLNALWFAVWIILNTNIVPGLAPFDPFPFGLLTMVVSLEAIFLAIIVLISQNRAAKIAEIREEADLQINSISEGEVSKTIEMLSILLKKNGIDIKQDPELAQMMRPIRSEDIEASLEHELA